MISSLSLRYTLTPRSTLGASERCSSSMMERSTWVENGVRNGDAMCGRRTTKLSIPSCRFDENFSLTLRVIRSLGDYIIR